MVGEVKASKAPLAKELVDAAVRASLGERSAAKGHADTIGHTWAGEMATYFLDHKKVSPLAREALQGVFDLQIGEDAPPLADQIKGKIWDKYLHGKPDLPAFIADFVGQRSSEEVEKLLDLSSGFLRIFGGEDTVAQIKDAIRAYAKEQTVDAPIEKHKIEDFGDGHFYPDRIVKMDTPRMQEMFTVLRDIVPGDEATRERLKDLIVYNAYGRVFPNPNSAGDLIPVIDERGQDGRYENSIVVIKRADGTLAVPGGFNDIGESMVATITREGKEETKITSLSDLTFIGEKSNPGRDKRANIMSTSAAGVVKLEELQAGDDAKDIFIVPLEVDGNINPLFLQRGKGVAKDAIEKEFDHNGMYSDHGDIIADFYAFWRKYGQPVGLNLRETLSLKKTIPASWYENVEPHPEGADTYPQLQNPFGEDSPLRQETSKTLSLTPNIVFTLEKTTQVLQESGMAKDEAQQKAKEMVFRLVAKDVLPIFPQAAVTIDCVVLDGDNVIVHKSPDGLYALPGSFHSPEKVQVGANIQSTAQEFMMRKWGADFHAIDYIGQVGGNDVLGRPADPRYPRVSHVLVGNLTAMYEPKPSGEFPEGSEVVRIPIWKDKANRILSDEITRSPWRFDHNKEILQTLFVRSLDVADPKRRFSAEQAFRMPQIKLSREERSKILSERNSEFRIPSFDEWVSRIRQPQERTVWRESLQKETQNQVALMGSVIGGEAYRDQAIAELRRLAGSEWKIGMAFNPVIEGRPWEPSDGKNEAQAIETSQYVIDVIKTEYAAVGSMVETPLLALFSVLFEHPIAFLVEDPKRDLAENEIRARKKTQLDLGLIRAVMPQHIQVFANDETLDDVVKDAYTHINASKYGLDEERQRIFLPRRNVIPRVVFSGSSYNPDRETIMASLSSARPQNWQGAIDTYVAPGSGKEWREEIDVPKEFHEKFDSLINIVDVRIDPDKEHPYGALSDVSLAIFRAAVSGTYAIIHMPEDPGNPKSDHNRARNLVNQQFMQLATRFDWINQYVRFVDSTGDILTCTKAIMDNYTPPTFD